MTSLISFSVVLLLFISFGTVISSSENNVYFVKFGSGEVYATEMNHISLLRNGDSKILFKFPRENLVAMRLHKSEAREYARRPDIVSVKEDEPVQISPISRRSSPQNHGGVEDESLLNGEVPYGITMVQALQVSEDEVGSSKSNMTVCIADTGYDSTHVDLPHGTVVTGKSFVSGENWNEDDSGHGTHVAGTIAAIQNSQGALGVIRNGSMNLLIAKVLGNSGSGGWAGVLAGVEWCAEQGANVINLSLGGPNYDQNHSDLYKRIYEEDGVLIVAAAGNTGTADYLYPASYESVVSVGAVDKLKNIATFSNRNDQVEMVGPGINVYSTVPGNAYSYEDGTSMASPHVAGVAALVWSHFPNLNAALIRDVLHKSAEDLGGKEGKDPKFGYGLVKAKEAFDLLNSTAGYSLSPSASSSEWPTSSPTLTSSPTISPTTSSPTTSPTECSGVVLAVTLMTDVYGYETSWKVTINEGEETILSGDGYDNNQEYYASACVEACDADTVFDLYTFSIFDSYGDGLGHNGGSYLVTMDGIMKAEGDGNFDYEETKEFSDCDSVALTSSPTISPTTSSPTTSPTECSGVVLAVTLMLGSWGSDKSWKVTILSINGEETILSGDGYGNNQEYYASACVEACDADTVFDLYTFSIFDTFGDEFGYDNDCSYLVTMDGIMKAEGGGNFGYEETKQFTHSTCPQQNKNSNSAFGSSKEIHFIFLMPVLLTILFFRASDQAHTPKSYV
jgi:hypothetical protein